MSNQFRRNQKELLKEECLRYLGGKKCAICGDISGFPCCYDFHHKIGAKEENISKMIARKTKLDAELKAELDKCSVVCVKCHRKITNKVMPLESVKMLYVLFFLFFSAVLFHYSFDAHRCGFSDCFAILFSI